MIVFIGSWILLIIWTVVIVRGLTRLREGVATGFRGRVANRTALVALALWIAVLGYAVGSITWLDIDLTDAARVFNTGVRMALLVVGLLLLWDRD